MTKMKPFALLLALILPVNAPAETVFDTGEDIFAEDGPWMAIPADFNPGPPTAAEIIIMADLDGDPLNITAVEREMIGLLMQVMIATDTPVTP